MCILLLLRRSKVTLLYISCYWTVCLLILSGGVAGSVFSHLLGGAHAIFGLVILGIVIGPYTTDV